MSCKLNPSSKLLIAIFIVSFCCNLAQSDEKKCEGECLKNREKKRKENIYTKEANEEGFKHVDEDEIIAEDEIINEKKDEKEVVKDGPKKKKIDPKKAKDVLNLMVDLNKKLNQMFENTFSGMETSAEEMKLALEKVKKEAKEKIKEVENKTGKDLDVVYESVKESIDNCVAQIKGFKTTLDGKRKEIEHRPKESYEISGEANGEELAEMIAKTVENMAKKGKEIEEIIALMLQNMIDNITSTQVDLSAAMFMHETSLNVNLITVRQGLDTSLGDMRADLKMGLQQTRSALTLTVSTMTTLVQQLKSSLG